MWLNYWYWKQRCGETVCITVNNLRKRLFYASCLSCLYWGLDINFSWDPSSSMLISGEKCLNVHILLFSSTIMHFWLGSGRCFPKYWGEIRGNFTFYLKNHFSRTPTMHNTGGKQASISIGAVPVPPEVLTWSWASRLVCRDMCRTV